MFVSLFTILVLNQSPGPAPLEFPNPIYHAGEVRTGQPLAHKFAFTNRGSEPVTIVELKTSCGCLAPAIAKRAIGPRESGEIALEVHTLTQPAGPHTWRVIARYQVGQTEHQCTLELRATLVSEIQVRPASLAFFIKQPRSHDLTITDTRLTPFTITAAGTSSPHLIAELVSAAPGTRNRTIRVSVMESCPDGRHSEVVWLNTDDSAYPRLKIPVTIVRAGRQRITALPDRVTLFTGGGPVGSAVIQLRDSEGQSIKVEEVETDGPLFVKWAAGPGPMATLRIGADKSLWTGSPFSGQVRIRANSQWVVIPVAGRATE